MIKLAVFDWNGTLLSDVNPVMAGVNNELAVFGLPPISLAEYRERYSIPLTGFYKHYGITVDDFKAHSDALATAFHSAYEAEASKAPTRPGTRQLLEDLHKRGVTRIILSNHTVEGIYLHLARLKLTHHFEIVLANDDLNGAHLKGKLDHLKKYLATSQFKPHEAVIIGDTSEEVEIGKTLGLKTVALSGGYNSISRLKRAKPDFLINKLSDLMGLLEEM